MQNAESYRGRGGKYTPNPKPLIDFLGWIQEWVSGRKGITGVPPIKMLGGIFYPHPPLQFASLPLKKKTSVRLLVWTTSAVHTLEYKATRIEQE